jgi:subtilase family serine protease
LLLPACGPASNQAANNQTQNFSQDVCPNALNGTPTCITPHALRVGYGIEPLIEKGFTGKGQTIIELASFDSPTLQQDMQVFDQTFHLPPIDLQVISPLTVPEADPEQSKDHWAQTTVSHVQILHAIAPAAKIIVLESPVGETKGTFGLPEFRQLLQYAIDKQLGNIVSLRWNVSEATLQDTQGQQEIHNWDELLNNSTINHHITYFATSGATGATTDAVANQQLASVPTVCFPADSPWVTSVGGTNLFLSSASSILSETGWSGSGGGFSHFSQMPSYQKRLPARVQQQFNNQRGIPDVSADNNPMTGLAVYRKGQWAITGGNSSLLVWAGLQAIANQMAGHPLGFINPGLYKLATSANYQQDFHDITQGDNTNAQAGVKGYSAAAGWDPVTGLGTPNAEKLIPDLIAALK